MNKPTCTTIWLAVSASCVGIREGVARNATSVSGIEQFSRTLRFCRASARQITRKIAPLRPSCRQRGARKGGDSQRSSGEPLDLDRRALAIRLPQEVGAAEQSGD